MSLGSRVARGWSLCTAATRPCPPHPSLQMHPHPPLPVFVFAAEGTDEGSAG
jgi:hypothetical protein